MNYRDIENFLAGSGGEVPPERRSALVALFFDCSASNITAMRLSNRVPMGRQYEAHAKSGGVLKVDGFEPNVDYRARAIQVLNTQRSRGRQHQPGQTLSAKQAALAQ